MQLTQEWHENPAKQTAELFIAGHKVGHVEPDHRDAPSRRWHAYVYSGRKRTRIAAVDSYEKAKQTLQTRFIVAASQVLA